MPMTLADFRVKGNPFLPPESRSVPTRALASSSLLLAIVIWLMASASAGQQPTSSSTEEEATEVSRQASSGPVTGVLFAQRSLDLLCEVGGTVLSCLELGDTFEEGELLISIDAPTLRFDLATARAQLTAAEAQVTIEELSSLQAQAELDRRLQSPETWSLEELDRSRLEARAGEARLNLALAERDRYEAQVAKLESQIAKATLFAAFSGVITARYVQPGELVEPNARLLRLITHHRLGIRFAVTAEEIRVLQPGRKLEISVPGVANDIHVPFLRFGPEIDTATGLAFAEAGWVDQEIAPGALAGMKVRVILPTLVPGDRLD